MGGVRAPIFLRFFYKNLILVVDLPIIGVYYKVEETYRIG